MTVRGRWAIGRRDVAVTVAAALICLCVAAPAAAAGTGWSRPFALIAPGTLDYDPPELAFSASGTVAAAFGIENVDTPGTSQAYLATRSPQGAVSASRAIPGAAQMLALAYDGSSLELLTGSAPAGSTCCISAQAIQVSAGGALGRPRTIVGGLAGATVGHLLTLADGQMLAAVATERGVWAVQSTRGDRFAGPHMLSATGQRPEALSVAWLGGENSVVAWAAGASGSTEPRSIYVSGGTRLSAPHRALNIVTVAPGHAIDELEIAGRGTGVTAAWVESWYDRRGAYHSQVEAADLGAHPRVRAVSPPGQLASGLGFAADAAGDQVMTWEACTLDDACTVQATLRGATGVFGPDRTLGPIDSSQTPSAAIGPQGQALAGWVSAGRPLAAVAVTAGGSFGPATALSASPDAQGMTVGWGPARQALAVWAQGTLNPSLVGAAFTAPSPPAQPAPSAATST